MKTINPKSLAITLDNLNELFFYGKKISPSDKAEAAKFIASHQGQPGSYRGMFAPAKYDYKNGITLFTGEKVTTGAGTAHILSEEACYVLFKLNVKNKSVVSALNKATDSLTNTINIILQDAYPRGYYCCGKCTAAYWKQLAVNGLETSGDIIDDGIEILNSLRDGKGKWRRFPYFYTIYAIHDIDLISVTDELKYAAPGLERYLKRAANGNIYNKRKRLLAEKVLERI